MFGKKRTLTATDLEALYGLLPIGINRWLAQHGSPDYKLWGVEVVRHRYRKEGWQHVEISGGFDVKKVPVKFWSDLYFSTVKGSGHFTFYLLKYPGLEARMDFLDFTRTNKNEVWTAQNATFEMDHTELKVWFEQH